jgi:four helix bundle protein
MKSYRDLVIYCVSYELAVRVHRITLNLPHYELHEEGSQLRRSSKSITSNIVEGYGRRRYKAEFVRFLVLAQASCDETVLHLNIINDTNNIETAEIALLVDMYTGLGKKLNRFTQYVESHWETNGIKGNALK